MKHRKNFLGALCVVVLSACGPATEKAAQPKAEAMRPASTPAPADQAPVYKDGDWWKVKVEVVQKRFSRSGNCSEIYLEYLVRIVEGKPRVYGLSAGKEEEIDCVSISRDLLDIPSNYQFLKFPLTVGATWSAQYVVSLRQACSCGVDAGRTAPRRRARRLFRDA